MARGNLLLGTARGSLGDITFYRYDSQQVSRVRVRKIKNPKTIEQLVPRIILTTVSKAYSAMQFICKDSFQDYSGAEKNMRRFLRVNNMWLKEVTYKYYYGWRDKIYEADYSGNYNEKDTFKMVINPYFVSEGDLPTVNYNKCNYENGLMLPVGTVKEMTYQQMIDLLGVPQGAQLTLLQLVGNGATQYVDKVMYSRVVLSPASGGMNTQFLNNGAVRNPNTKNEGDLTVNAIDNEGSYTYAWKIPFTQEYEEQVILGAALIVSYYENGKWRRSSQYIKCVEGVFESRDEYGILIPMSEALETWEKDVNSSLYLNQSNTNTSAQTRTLETAEADEEDVAPKRVRKKSN